MAQHTKIWILPEDQELYVFAESQDRIAKERSMRRRKLKWLWVLLAQIKDMDLSRDALLMKLGSAQSKVPAAGRLIDVKVDKEGPGFTYRLNRQKLKQVRRREGRYRTNLTETDPVKLWNYYLQLVHVEEAFRTLKSDLAIRPIFHQEPERIEAHAFVAFLSYCVYVMLGRQLKALAPGLTARSALDKFAAVQMVDVRIPTTDAREILLTRYTQPKPELELLLERCRRKSAPLRPPPLHCCSADLWGCTLCASITWRRQSLESAKFGLQITMMSQMASAVKRLAARSIGFSDGIYSPGFGRSSPRKDEYT